MERTTRIQKFLIITVALVGLVVVACGGSTPAAAVGDDGDGAQKVAVVDIADDGHAEDGDDVGATTTHSEEAELAALDDGHDTGAATEIVLNVVEDGSTWGFDPGVIEVEVGERVLLTLVNDGMAEHDVEIADLIAEFVEAVGEVHTDIEGGQHAAETVAAHALAGHTAGVMFTPMVAGEYEFACTLPGHRELAMVGTLIVLPTEDGQDLADDHDAVDDHDAADEHDTDV